MVFTILLTTFFSVYSNDCKEAIGFIEKNKSIIQTELFNLSNEDKTIALSIVAPELSQFSLIFNEFEMQTLYIFYLNSGKSDFSVGYFQMKPSFIEAMEKFLSKDKNLYHHFKDLLPKGNNRDKRRYRLKKLTTLEGQLRYLSLFINICKKRTDKIKFKDTKDKIRYWSTLYNSGLSLSTEAVKDQQSRCQFPHFTKKFNYSDVSVEFYEAFKNISW